MLANPNLGNTSFDNILWSLFQVWEIMTLEGWTENQMVLLVMKLLCNHLLSKVSNNGRSQLLGLALFLRERLYNRLFRNKLEQSHPQIVV